VSSNGTLVYLPAVDTKSVLGLVSREGKWEPLSPPPDNMGLPRLSPDGNSVAFLVAHGVETTIRIYDRVRGSTTSLKRQSIDEGFAWRDNRSFVIASRSKSGLFLQNIDTGESSLLVSTPPGANYLRNPSFSRDGTLLTYTVQTGLLHDIWVLTMGDKPTAAPFVQGPASEYGGRFSPDMRWLAYTSNESGRGEVYVRGYPAGPVFPVSTAGGDGPVWKPDGRELYFVGQFGGAPKMMAVTVTPDGATLRLGAPVPLFDWRTTLPTGEVERYVNNGNFGAGFDVLANGGFLMNRRPDFSGSRELILVQNWFEELKALVTVK
jgi:serine/threonine-protein kinase